MYTLLNSSGSDVTVSDLDITILNGNTYDLANKTAPEIRASRDLMLSISKGELILKDGEDELDRSMALPSLYGALVLRNDSGSDVEVNDMGITVRTGSTYTLTQESMRNMRSSDELCQYLANGSLIVNDGINDIDPIVAISFIYGIMDVLEDRTVRYKTITSNYTVDVQDDIIYANASGGSFVITLPEAPNNKIYTIKKKDGPPNVVTIVGYGTDTIDGEASVTVRRRETSLQLHFNVVTNEWNIM